MSYTPPTITASSTTFALLKAGGLFGHLERLIDANSFTDGVKAEIRSAKSGGLDQILYEAQVHVEQYLRGAPISAAQLDSRLLDLATVFHAFQVLMDEAATLVAANHGTLRVRTANAGYAESYRTFP